MVNNKAMAKERQAWLAVCQLLNGTCVWQQRTL